VVANAAAVAQWGGSRAVRGAARASDVAAAAAAAAAATARLATATAATAIGAAKAAGRTAAWPGALALLEGLGLHTQHVGTAV
jgi:hypothetical protein